MEALPKPDVILTHESDLDGLLAGALLQKLAKKLFGTDIPLEAHHYNFWKQRELRERAAWVTDFTFETRMDKQDWVVIDHHVTEVPPKNARLIHDVNKSAGLLCYELCKEHGISSPVLDRLVHLNNVADLFLEDDPDFALACDYANLVKIYQFWNLHTLIGGDLEKLLDHPLLEVMAVKRKIENPLGFEWSKANITEIRKGGEIFRVGHVIPARQHSFRQLSQPQRRGAQDCGKISGRRPCKCRRRASAKIHPQCSRWCGISAADFERQKPDAANAAQQPRKRLCQHRDSEKVKRGFALERFN
jgi:hypothetical protein